MNYSDEELQKKIIHLEQCIERLVRMHELWQDCGFTNYLKHVDGEPHSPTIVSIMYFEGPLYEIFWRVNDNSGFTDQFNDLLENLGFSYDFEDHCTMHFYAEEEELAQAFDNYFHWQWVCNLLVPDTSDVYEELYSYFAQNPDALHKLGWREYEILLFRIFQNQGFQAELGPGRGDGGVDIKLLQRDPLGDLLTLVQAKKYAKHIKIDLQAVQAPAWCR